ncbi:MAG: 30S ribosomal protein S17 [Bryobacteraceae bacterium]
MAEQRPAAQERAATSAGDSLATAIRPGAHRNEKIGEVVSTKMAKTIVVEVTRRVPHSLYKRIVSSRKKFYAHDETRTANVGDIVRIVECRPLSRLKRWELANVIRRAVQVSVEHPALAARADTRVKKTVKKKSRARA